MCCSQLDRLKDIMKLQACVGSNLLVTGSWWVLMDRVMVIHYNLQTIQSMVSQFGQSVHLESKEKMFNYNGTADLRPFQSPSRD